MRIKLQITRLAGQREVVFDIDRDGLSRRADRRLASDREHRYGMALEAIRHSPSSAEEIAEDALDG